MRRRFSNDLVPNEAVLNRIRARRKLGRKLLVVEGQTDEEFVEQYVNLNSDVQVVISNGKRNAKQAIEELGLEKEVLALVDWDYEWLGADSLVYPRSHMCAYDGHSLESFKFFFERPFQHGIDTICARWLGVLRAFNHQQGGNLDFNNRRAHLVEIFQEAIDDGDDIGFVSQMLGLLGAHNAFGITPENFRNGIADQISNRLDGDLEYLIHGHDIETFHDVAKGKGAFARASSEGLQARVEKSMMVAFLAEHGFVHG
jgi:hypothetical protein